VPRGSLIERNAALASSNVFVMSVTLALDELKTDVLQQPMPLRPQPRPRPLLSLLCRWRPFRIQRSSLPQPPPLLAARRCLCRRRSPREMLLVKTLVLEKLLQRRRIRGRILLGA
jgi:hypothetical protein